MIDKTHDPALTSWVESANKPAADFPIQNLPFGSFRQRGEEQTRLGVAIGDMVLDAGELARIPSMAAIMALPRATRANLRQRLSEFLSKYSPGSERFLVPMPEITMGMPCQIPDYTDFFTSLDHATNVGSMFRPGNPLSPNFKWMPIAYHGRASSVVLSGTPIRRPRGQFLPDPDGPPVYGPSRQLDYELELGAFIGPGNAMGEPIPIAQAEEHLFGVCLLNDWSARDIQAWESQPLGPFLSKNFATSISPWIVTKEALEPFRCSVTPRAESDPRPLLYLDTAGGGAFRITMEVWLRSAKMKKPVNVSSSDFSTMYWTLAQMLTHHASNGCPLRPGDLVGSGTVSGPEKHNRGCLLEMTRRGSEPFELADGEVRTFLEDGDEVTLRGWCEAPGYRRIGLGECRGTIQRALD
jgi:fumarylacetoacetase